MATDMDIDMELDVGLLDDETAVPGMEEMPEIEATVSTPRRTPAQVYAI